MDDKMLRNIDDDDLAKRLREATNMYQADCELKIKCAFHIEGLEAMIADRDHYIEELEALYGAAVNDAFEAVAYADALEVKLYDMAQDELKGQKGQNQ